MVRQKIYWNVLVFGVVLTVGCFGPVWAQEQTKEQDRLQSQEQIQEQQQAQEQKRKRIESQTQEQKQQEIHKQQKGKKGSQSHAPGRSGGKGGR